MYSTLAWIASFCYTKGSTKCSEAPSEPLTWPPWSCDCYTAPGMLLKYPKYVAKTVRKLGMWEGMY